MNASPNARVLAVAPGVGAIVPHGWARWLLTVSLLLLPGWINAQTTEDPPLLVDGPGVVDDPLPSDVARRRPVLVNPVLLGRLDQPGSHPASLELFDGSRFGVLLSTRQSMGPGRCVWSGEIPLVPFSSVQVTTYDGAWSLRVQLAGEAPYRVVAAAGGGYWLEQLRVGPQGGAHCRELPEVASAGSRTAARAPAPMPAPGDTGTLFVDVLALYSKTARSQAGGDAQIRASILSSFAAANQVHARTSTHVQLRLLDIQMVNYFDNGDIGVDLDHLSNDADGWLDEVPPLRESLGADLVHLFVDSQGAGTNTGTIGIAQRSGTYGVTKWSGGNGLVFAHETGHNLGCRHQAAVDSGGTFNHAWQIKHRYFDIRSLSDTDITAETVMWAQATSSMIPRFSTPDQTFTLHPFASDDATLSIGVADQADNTRYLRENGVTTVQRSQPKFFVQAGVPGTGDATPMNPSPSLHVVFDAWYPSTGADARQPVDVKLRQGHYNEAIRITQKCRLQRWDDTGPIVVGTP